MFAVCFPAGIFAACNLCALKLPRASIRCLGAPSQPKFQHEPLLRNGGAGRAHRRRWGGLGNPAWRRRWRHRSAAAAKDEQEEVRPEACDLGSLPGEHGLAVTCRPALPAARRLLPAAVPVRSRPSPAPPPPCRCPPPHRCPAALRTWPARLARTSSSGEGSIPGSSSLVGEVAVVVRDKSVLGSRRLKQDQPRHTLTPRF